MPIEIKELYIKVTAQDTNTSSAGNTEGGSTESKEQLIEECIERVLEILNEKQDDR